MAGRVGGRPIHFGGVLARECTPTVAGESAVGVDDDLAPGEPSVPDRAADHEPSGRVHQQVGAQLVRIVEDRRAAAVVTTSFHRSSRIWSGMTSSACWVEIRTRSTLTGDAVDVAHRDHGLAVGRRYGKRTVLTHSSQSAGKSVCQRDWHRHQLGSLVAGVAEHHSLVAGAG